MGIGNTTPSSAIFAAVTGKSPEEVTGKGTGIDETTLGRKVEVVRRALEVNRPDPSDPVDVLAKVGGFEIGGIAGLILGGASLGIPVIVDGFISTAGALIAVGVAPQVRDYIVCAHKSAAFGHEAALSWLKCRPLLDLDMRLGEGTGAAIGMWLMELGERVLHDMATFEEAAVAEGEEV
jgi:nicotinate-nucleotide--dimethylbenzimidazole phosphoribosyltransferase